MNRLLALLVDYDMSSLPSLQRKQALAQIESLESRGFVSMARDQIQPLKRKGSKAGNWTLLLDLNQIDGRLGMLEPVRYDEVALRERFKERQMLIDALQIELQLRQNWELLLLLKRQSQMVGRTQVLEEIAGWTKQFEEKEGLHSSLEILRLIGKALLALLEGDSNIAMAEYAKAIKALESDPIIVEENPASAMFHYYNYLNLCHATRNYEDFPRLLPLVEKLERQTQRSTRNLHSYATMLGIVYHANCGSLETARDLALEQVRKIQQPPPGVPASNYLVMIYNAVVLAFFAEQFDLALKTISEILKSQKIKVRTDLRDTFHLLEAIMLLESNRYDRFEAKLESLRTRPTSNDATKALIRLMVRKLAALNETEYAVGGNRLDWASFETELKELCDTFPTLELVGVNEIRVWLAARSQRVSMREILQSHPDFSFPVSRPSTVSEG